MPTKRLTLGDTITSLYQIAVVEGKATSTVCLRALANYYVQELAARGLAGAKTERTLPGGGRPKQWDVAWKLHEKYRLAISLKSILRNLAGTVPNRTDDLMGEVVNLQMYSPEIVIAYMMVFDVSEDSYSESRGGTWCDLFRSRLTQLSTRRAPSWSVGMIESFVILEVDFSKGPVLLTAESQVHEMFDRVTEETKRRNPSI